MSSEKQYIQLFADNETLICEHSCPAMNAVRHTASEAFTRLGFPSRKTEEYKYIDVDSVKVEIIRDGNVIKQCSSKIDKNTLNFDKPQDNETG